MTHVPGADPASKVGLPPFITALLICKGRERVWEQTWCGRKKEQQRPQQKSITGTTTTHTHAHTLQNQPNLWYANIYRFMSTNNYTYSNVDSRDGNGSFQQANLIQQRFTGAHHNILHDHESPSVPMCPLHPSKEYWMIHHKEVPLLQVLCSTVSYTVVRQTGLTVSQRAVSRRISY